MTKQIEPSIRYSNDWLQSLDQRTSIAQDLRNRHTALCDDLGGYSNLSYQQRALIDRAIFLEYHLQQEELKLAQGQDFDSGKWTQACNSLSGLFSKLGLERNRREVSLNQYIKASQ
ncbi:MULTISPECIES: hypothetical protein [unclassified Alteromonas]|uniref:hypothetical protein n=1 Tax=unclassified Alteromonas TaxID=2614992 RepID=UPI0005097BC2|nr:MULTISPECIES: hypothetical protein [unclassified Alteromonas]